MKDGIGQSLKVGDNVVYVWANSGSAHMQKAVITSMDDLKVFLDGSTDKRTGKSPWNLIRYTTAMRSKI